MLKEEVSNVQLENFSMNVNKEEASDKISNQKTGGETVINNDYSLIEDVEVSLNAYIGEAKIPIGELFSLKAGSVVTLSTRLGEPVVLYLKDRAVAKGQIVAVGDSFGIEISEVI